MDEPSVRELARGILAAIEKKLGIRLNGCAPFERVCEVLALQGCTQYRVEPDYYCRDFMSEYSFLYSRVVEEVCRLAIRVHFWGESTPNDGYLGYCVIRPLTRQADNEVLSKVGRTVLRYDRLPNHYVRCKARYSAHLGSEAFAVEGSPFMQQDTQVMCCAHVAMWVANRILSCSHATIRDFYPHEIAALSTSRLTIGPTLPTPGLIVHQMLACLQQMGFEPLYYDYGVEGDDKQLSMSRS